MSVDILRQIWNVFLCGFCGGFMMIICVPILKYWGNQMEWWDSRFTPHFSVGEKYKMPANAGHKACPILKYWENQPQY